MVAILDVQGNEVLEKDEIWLLTETLRSTIRRFLPPAVYYVVNRENLLELLATRQIDLAECVGAECAIDAGRKIGSDYVITGEVRSSHEEYILSLWLYETSTGNLESQVLCKKALFNEITAAVGDSLGGALAGVLPSYGELIVNSLGTDDERLDARVFIDWEECGTTGHMPLKLKQPPGVHHVLVQCLEGEATGKEYSDEVDVLLDEIVEITARFPPEPGAGRFNGSDLVHILVRTSPDSAGVKIDNRFRGLSPLTATLPPGLHAFTFVRHGYSRVDSVVHVPRDSSGSFLIGPVRLPRESGYLSVRSRPPGLTVLVDGEIAGKTPLTRFECPAGTHDIVVHGNNRFEHTRLRNVHISPGEVTERYILPSPVPETRPSPAAEIKREPLETTSRESCFWYLGGGRNDTNFSDHPDYGAVLGMICAKKLTKSNRLFPAIRILLEGDVRWNSFSETDTASGDFTIFSTDVALLGDLSLELSVGIGGVIYPYAGIGLAGVFSRSSLQRDQADYSYSTLTAGPLGGSSIGYGMDLEIGPFTARFDSRRRKLSGLLDYSLEDSFWKINMEDRTRFEWLSETVTAFAGFSSGAASVLGGVRLDRRTLQNASIENEPTLPDEPAVYYFIAFRRGF